MSKFQNTKITKNRRIIRILNKKIYTAWWNSVANCNEKNVITNAKWTWMQKNKKTSFKTWKFVTFFQNWQHFFEIPFFFCKWTKKVDIRDKKKQKLCNNFNSNFSKIPYYGRFSTFQMKLCTFLRSVSLKLSETKPKTKVSLKLDGKKWGFLA